ncbi:lectin c-type domain-containing protein [Ditylenchus destructor]|uniref:Lectin c-type domain-containing protein n=1 Tax=Ditylenchus destructor TaxID=166010 RepID=A0AAD4NAI3_9BILA|nr:lectin c-type domain-containing protein [Ditylenchus destructor]
MGYSHVSPRHHLARICVGIIVGVGLIGGLSFLIYVLLNNDSNIPWPVDEEGWTCTAVYGQNCVKSFSERRSWDDAQRQCLDEQQQDATLASAVNSNEWEFLKAFIKKQSDVSSSQRCESYWLGGTWSSYEKQFVWSDGRKVEANHSLPIDLNSNLTNGDGLSVDTENLQLKVGNKKSKRCFMCLWNVTASFLSASDCQDLKKRGKTRSGLYRIKESPRTSSLSTNKRHKVLCEMESSGGGWTVFQQRVDGRTVFWNRTWTEYRDGFGQLGRNSEFWMGLELLHKMSTIQPNTSLRVELWGDRNPNSSKYTNDYLESEYYNFAVGNESTDYSLQVQTVWPGVGNASGGWFDITFSRGRKFSTVDRINDPMPSCVTDYHLGGWWLHYCSLSSLNGEYNPPIAWGNGYGMMWVAHGIYIINPQKSRMMFRKNG